MLGGGGKVWLWCVFCWLADLFSFVVVDVVVLVRRRQYRASFYGGPPSAPGIGATPMMQANAAASAYDRQVGGQ